MPQCEYDELWTDEAVCEANCPGYDTRCNENYYWNEEACMCFSEIMCTIGCMDGTVNNPTIGCGCMPRCAYDELFTREPVCECFDDNRCGNVCPDSECGES